MNHQVKTEELIEWATKQRKTYASSSREGKKLLVTLNGSYEVVHKKSIILETSIAEEAVREYNNI